MKGSKDRYFQEQTDSENKLVPEGVEGGYPLGSLSESVYQLIGGLRAGMGYAGCHAISELKTKTRLSAVQLPD